MVFMSMSTLPTTSRAPDAPAAHRQCGGCTACCKVLSIAPLGKAAGEPCQHLCASGGCGDYANRPGVCRGFVCMWVADGRGLFSASHRPDRLGLMLTGRVEADGSRHITAHEVWPGAADRQAGQQALAALRDVARVRVVPATGPRVEIHAENLERFRQARSDAPR